MQRNHILEGWISTSIKTLEVDIPSAQRQRLKTMFYMSAAHLYNTLVSIEDKNKLLEDLREELLRYREEFERTIR